MKTEGAGKQSLLQLPEMLWLMSDTPQPDTKAQQGDANHHIDPVRISRNSQCPIPALRIRNLVAQTKKHPWGICSTD